MSRVERVHLSLDVAVELLEPLVRTQKISVPVFLSVSLVDGKIFVELDAVSVSVFLGPDGGGHFSRVSRQ